MSGENPVRTIGDATPLLLASGSPRRSEILRTLGLAIRVSPVSVDESVAPNEAARAYLERVVAWKLAAAIARDEDAERDAACVLVADTSVVVDGDILGKPVDARDAEAMTTRLAGRTHHVWTRFAIAIDGREKHAETVSTAVTFRALTSREIARYASSGEGTDKAGAYAVQGMGAAIVSRIDGSYTNVVGLPACEVWLALDRLGLLP